MSFERMTLECKREVAQCDNFNQLKNSLSLKNERHDDEISDHASSIYKDTEKSPKRQIPINKP